MFKMSELHMIKTKLELLEIKYNNLINSIQQTTYNLSLLEFVSIFEMSYRYADHKKPIYIRISKNEYKMIKDKNLWYVSTETINNILSALQIETAKYHYYNSYDLDSLNSILDGKKMGFYDSSCEKFIKFPKNYIEICCTYCRKKYYKNKNNVDILICPFCSRYFDKKI